MLPPTIGIMVVLWEIRIVLRRKCEKKKRGKNEKKKRGKES